MMKKWVGIVEAVLVVAGISLAAVPAAEGASHRLGVGANYWVTLDDLDTEDLKDLDENGLSYFASYQYWPSLLGVELLMEIYPDWLSKENAYSPEAYLLLGSAIYAGAGVGIMYFNEEWGDDPFFALKGGLCLELLPRLFLDIAANYRFRDKTQLKESNSDIDTDTVFLGAAVRLGW